MTAAPALALALGVCLAIPVDASTLAQDADYRKDPLAYWTQALRSPDARKRRDAAHAVAGFATRDPEVVNHLIAALDDPDRSVRYTAATSLGKIGPRAAAAVPRLLREYSDTERWEAGEALVGIGAASVPGLVDLTRRSSGEVQYRAAVTLCFIRPEGLAAALADLATDGDTRYRAALAKAAVVGKQDSVKALVVALRDREAAVRLAAASSLGRFTHERRWSGGRTASTPYRDAVAALYAARKDPNVEVRTRAATALDHLQRPPARVVMDE